MLLTFLPLWAGTRDGGSALWVLAEPAALTVLMYTAARWSPPRAAVWSVAWLCTALALMMFRLFEGSVWETLAAGASWCVPGLALVVLAAYQRGQERRRFDAVAAARREQRLELAHDLHDFAAHDISEVVAQAQAGRMVLAVGDDRVAALLERIEKAGLRALDSMDRTVRLLRASDSAALAPVGGAADIAALVLRFNRVGSPVAVLDERLSRPVGREAGAVAYRLVSEALTNVRRHAVGAENVYVGLDDGGGLLAVAVADDGRRRSRGGRRTSSGLGLPGLAARVEALGGEFAAGPREGGGWRVEARIPSRRLHTEGVTT
nr:hypothetical protein GCM10025732_11450 [Glycomyces mayteni]